jgi:hypothetical protein
VPGSKHTGGVIAFFDGVLLGDANGTNPSAAMTPDWRPPSFQEGDRQS